MSLFGKLRGSARVPPVKARTIRVAGQEIDASVVFDALGGVLRALGRHSFAIDGSDVPTLTRRFEAWASHLLVLGPHPDAGEDKAAEDGRSDQQRRDWGGLQGFVSEQRKREQLWVQGTIGALRDSVWDLAHSATRIISGANEADHGIGEEIDKLRSAADGKPVEELRREVIAAARKIEHIADERRRMQADDAEHVSRHILALHNELKQAKSDSALDALTRLHNRRSFDDYMSRIGVIERMTGCEAALLVVDADHFKKVNDAYGHAIGDEVLRGIADALSRSFPAKDDFVARYGGEEFIVILTDLTVDSARAKAERLRQCVTEVVAERLPALSAVTVSVGLALRGKDEPTSAWVARADKALYAAKARGRNRVVVAP